jgi:hypothetical protein
MLTEIPDQYFGWWRFTETDTWPSDGIEALGPAVFSLTDRDDRLRMHYLIAELAAAGTSDGVVFAWIGAWEYDRMSGSGYVRLRGDGRLEGELISPHMDSSRFIAEPTDDPEEMIPDSPSYHDKCKRW